MTNQHQTLTFQTSQNIMTTMTVLSTQPMPAGEFKAHCLEVMDQVKLKKTEVIVTKHGKPVAKLVPVDSTGPELFGFLAGSVTYHADIVGPIDEPWDVLDDAKA